MESTPTPPDTTARILGRIEERTEGIGYDVREIKLLIQAQNGRIRDLERKADANDGGWKAAGIISSVVAAVTTTGISLFGRWFQ